MRRIDAKTAQALLAGIKKKPSNKHNAKKVTVDGVTYDSGLESRWYAQLQQRERAGEISNLQRQVAFTLMSGFRSRSGEAVRPIKIVVDATWTDSEGRRVIGEAKGQPTEAWKLKWKMLRSRFADDETVVFELNGGVL